MKKHKQGFLLIEVLTALSVLALGLLTVTRSFSVSIQANNYSHEYIIAMILAKGKMTETINQEQGG
jgi:type II secretion system protein I